MSTITSWCGAVWLSPLEMNMVEGPPTSVLSEQPAIATVRSTTATARMAAANLRGVNQMIGHAQLNGPRLPRALLNYVAYGSAILIALLAVTAAAAHLPQGASAVQDKANNMVDVIRVGQTIDTKALPRQ